MPNLNRVFLIGHLTRDPEIRTTTNGTKVAGFGLAINSRYKDKNTGQYVDDPTFVEVAAWDTLAGVVGELLHKGSCIHLEGKLKLDQWNDKQTGQKRQTLKVVMHHMQLLDRKVDRQGEAAIPFQEDVTSGVASQGNIPF